MLSKDNLEKFTRLYQTDIENVAREYCQHLFLSFLYQQAEAEKLYFKGDTALRIVLKSPRFSEDLDFSSSHLSKDTVEKIFAKTLSQIERTGIGVDITETKGTTGGYLGIATFLLHDLKIRIQVEISFRKQKEIKGERVLIVSDYLPAYTLVQLQMEELIKEKTTALFSRQKPRDFYDYFFLLSGNYPVVKEKENLIIVQELLEKSKINFKEELKKMLPVSHQTVSRNFRDILDREIKKYL